LHDAHVRADLEQRLVDAAQVAGAVIEQGNHKVKVKSCGAGWQPEMNQNNFVHTIGINWLEVLFSMNQKFLL
jgi:hypothetical protein